MSTFRKMIFIFRGERTGISFDKGTTEIFAGLLKKPGPGRIVWIVRLFFSAIKKLRQPDATELFEWKNSFDGEAVFLRERADVVGRPAGELLNHIEVHMAFEHIEHNIPLAFGFASF